MVAPLAEAPDIELVIEQLQPQKPYPFPWPFFQFFDTFPETVYADPLPIAPLSAEVTAAHFDLVILAYQVWFLSPAQPITALLQSAQGQALLAGKPVITLIGCRNMWLMAQEALKEQLKDVGAKLIDNVVLTDPAGSAASFFSTPLWVLTGNKGPFFGGLLSAAGISEEDIRGASRFGHAIAEQLPSRSAHDVTPMLDGLGAVSIRENLIASESIAIRSFRVWGGLLRALGKPGSLLRRAVLVIYILFLITMIVTLVPISTLIKRISAPWTRERTARLRRYYAAPSGEEHNKVASVND